jgi:hypothetical protein
MTDDINDMTAYDSEDDEIHQEKTNQQNSESVSDDKSIKV